MTKWLLGCLTLALQGVKSSFSSGPCMSIHAIVLRQPERYLVMKKEQYNPSCALVVSRAFPPSSFVTSYKVN